MSAGGESIIIDSCSDQVVADWLRSLLLLLLLNRWLQPKKKWQSLIKCRLLQVMGIVAALIVGRIFMEDDDRCEYLYNNNH